MYGVFRNTRFVFTLSKKNHWLFTINVYYLKAAPFVDLDFEMPWQFAKLRNTRVATIRIKASARFSSGLRWLLISRRRAAESDVRIEAHLRFNATLLHYAEIWSCFECLHRVTVRRINHDLGIVISVNRRKSE